MLLTSLHAASRAHRSCHSVSSWNRSSNFGALGITCKRWILVSNVGVTYYGFCEFYTSDWFPYVWVLPQNRWRLQRLRILKYATRLSCIFQHSHCTFVTILFRPFARLFFHLAMRIRALFSKSGPTLGLVEQAFWRMPVFHRMNWCKFLWGISCRDNRNILPLGLFPLGLLVLDAFLSFCRVEELGERFGCVVFARLLISWRKRQVSPLEHCTRWLSTANKLLEFFVHAVLSPDSSICENQVQLSSDESPHCTITIRSWVSQTLVFLICTILPSSGGIFVTDNNNSVPLWIEFLNIVISKTSSE